MMKAKLFWLAALLPKAARRLKKVVCTRDIGLNKGTRTIDGSVHMALGSQMHNRLGRKILQNLIQSILIANIGLDKLIIWTVTNGRQIIQACCICQRI